MKKLITYNGVNYKHFISHIAARDILNSYPLHIRGLTEGMCNLTRFDVKCKKKVDNTFKEFKKVIFIFKTVSN